MCVQKKKTSYFTNVDFLISNCIGGEGGPQGCELISGGGGIEITDEGRCGDDEIHFFVVGGGGKGGASSPSSLDENIFLGSRSREKPKIVNWGARAYLLLLVLLL